MGRTAGLANPWPLSQHDHPLYFHSALVTRSFLKHSGMTAGYDPSFMSGYAKSVVWPSSSTLPELAVALCGGSRPELAYKVYVLLSAAIAPWLVWAACAVFKLRPTAGCLAVLAFLIYVWCDFPINYVTFGMLPYFLSVPLGLLTAAVLARFLRRGGFGWWLASALSTSAALLVHLTAPMLLVPAGGLAYLVALWQPRGERARMPASRHVGFWVIPLLALALNAFWWLPGLWLSSTKGPSDFALVNSDESVSNRLAQIATMRTPAIESVLCGLGLLGMVILARHKRVAGAAVGGFLAAGFAWGYLAGFTHALDPLQPGRHTFAFYTASCVAAGVALAELGSLIRSAGAGVVVCGCAALTLIGLRVLGPELEANLRARLSGPEPFLSSEPSVRLKWVINQMRKHIAPGERLLYEEEGFSRRGIPDPFRGGRYSGLIPTYTGVELIGGPYLHASLNTNFTQFGEGRLFGRTEWDRAYFERYAKLYRPQAILCWSPYARAFCRAHPDLFEVVATLNLREDGELLFGRVKGFDGAAIRGTATVQAEPGRLNVSALAAELDGMVVLRYHSVPYLRSDPPVRLEAVHLESDPVPFIGIRPTASRLTIELDLPP
jgi:hypothetical protein